ARCSPCSCSRRPASTGRALRSRRRPPRQRRRLPLGRAALHQADQRDLLRAGAAARHRGAAPPAHAVLHGARREGGARLDRLGRAVHRRVLRHDHARRRRGARAAALGLGVLAIVASVLAGQTFNVSILVGLAFAVAASANLPALVMALFWPRFNTTGAVAGVLGGLLVSLVMIVLSPPVWPGP